MRSPFHGITTARTEKYDKRLANRKFRKATTDYLRKEPLDSEAIVFDMNQVSNVWSFDKDGKYRFDAAAYPEWLRK